VLLKEVNKYLEKHGLILREGSSPIFFVLELGQEMKMIRCSLNSILINGFFFVFAFAWVLYFSGFRDFGAGNDTINYVFAFSQINGPLDAYQTGMSYYGSKEFLFWFLAGVVKVIFGDNPRIWLLINCAISFIGSAIVYLKLSKELGWKYWALLLVLLYFTYQLVFISSYMRQMIAVPFLYLSLHHAYNKNPASAAFFFFMSFSFHYSAILFFPLIFIFLFDFVFLFNKIYAVFAILFGGIFLQLIDFMYPLLSGFGITDKVDLYISQGYQAAMEGRSAVSSLNLVFSAISLICALFFLDKESFIYKVCFYILALFFVFFDFPIILVRLLPYLFILIPFLYLMVVSKFVRSISLRILMGFFLFSLVLVIMMMSYSAKYTLGLL